jgi:hypothetical protein
MARGVCVPPSESLQTWRAQWPTRGQPGVFASMNVRGNTKSEARAELKRALKGPVPPCTVFEKV